MSEIVAAVKLPEEELKKYLATLIGHAQAPPAPILFSVGILLSTVQNVAVQGTDFAAKGTNNAGKGTDFAAKGTNNAGKGSDFAAKGTNNAAKGTGKMLTGCRAISSGRWLARAAVEVQGPGQVAARSEGTRANGRVHVQQVPPETTSIPT